MRAALVLALAALLALSTAAWGGAGAGSADGLTPDVLQRVLSFGPWPPAPPRDPSNRLSGDPRAIELGRRLFLDPGLSGDGRVACSTCHDPARGFTDGRPRAAGAGGAVHDRNTQGLLDVADQRWFGWDGGTDSLWAAAIRPLLSPVEMASSATRVAARLRQDPGHASAWQALHGSPIRAAQDERLLVDAAKAMAAWMETLRSPRTAFDAFRDALASGDTAAAARYPADARRGLAIFAGRGNCWMCHLGPGFSNGEFHDVGIPFVVAPGRVDPGRHAGLRRLHADPYNLAGPWADRGDGPDPSLKTRTVRLEHRNWGEWRTPGLRGLGATAPYMHDGRLATLHAVVRHYSALDEDRLHADGEAILRPLRLSAGEIDDLVAFLRSLDTPAPSR